MLQILTDDAARLDTFFTGLECCMWISLYLTVQHLHFDAITFFAELKYTWIW